MYGAMIFGSFTRGKPIYFQPKNLVLKPLSVFSWKQKLLPLVAVSTRQIGGLG